MNLSRCEKGHFYDKEKYSTCPHCAGGSATDDSLTTVFTEGTPTMAGAGVTEPATEGFAPYPEAKLDSNMMTQAVEAGTEDTPTMPIDFTTPIAPAVDEAADDDDDHTIGFFDDSFFATGAASVPPTAVNSAPAPQKVNKVSTPCVGWLIALGGAHIGTDFRLKTGKNFIGRSTNMDVALTDDKSVSRERHAVVVYEPKTHMYFVQPGDSSSLVYHNNEVVLSPVKLQAYDMVTVGDVNLLFVPLCGERFNWSELLEEMKKGNN